MTFAVLLTKKQPDLNWENPEVREEVYKNINSQIFQIVKLFNNTSQISNSISIGIIKTLRDE